MSGYFMNFIVYTSAMIGIIFLAILVYKKCSYNGVSKSKFLNIEDSINLAPRKNLYVVRAGQERFLIASDAERTSLISKLDEKVNMKTSRHSVDELSSVLDFQHNSNNSGKKVFKNIINNI